MKTEWFRHDTDARNDIKLKKLARDHGLAGIGAFWVVVEILFSCGGTATVQELEEELSFIDGSENFLNLLSVYNLISIEDGKVSSQRVQSEIAYQEENKQRKSEIGRKAVNARWHKNTEEYERIQKNTNIYEAIRPDTTRQDITRQNNISISDINTCNKLSGEYLKDGAKLNASASKDEPEARVPVVTIISNRKEEIPVYEDSVKVWKDAYPAVDIIAELKKMKAWSISNPRYRKTAEGMKRFIDSWLKREQDKAGCRPSTKKLTGIDNDPNDFRLEDLHL